MNSTFQSALKKGKASERSKSVRFKEEHEEMGNVGLNSDRVDEETTEGNKTRLFGSGEY